MNMIERLGLATPEGLEAGLRELGAAVAYPPTPSLAEAVSARLSSGVAPPIPLRPRWRPLRRALLLAAAVALLVAGAAIGIRFGLDALRITFDASPSPVGTPATGRLFLGTSSTLEEARLAADFALLVPDVLGPPDEVYLGGAALRGQIALVYRVRAGLPEGLVPDVGLLVTENRGSIDRGMVNKIVGAGGRVERIIMDGEDAYLFSGEPHLFWYLDEHGAFVEGSGRRVGDALVWQRGGVLYRIEGQLGRDALIAIAASMR
jgi:hypothetical protein